MRGPTSGPSRLAAFAAPLVVALALAALIGRYAYVFIHHKIYQLGPYLFDMGMFNAVLGPAGQGLRMAPAFGVASLFSIHVTPILLLFAPLARLLGWSQFEPLEWLLTVGFAASAATVFVVMRAYLKPVGRWIATPLAAAFAIAFCLSGVMHAIADYPHFEILYVPLAIAALALVFNGHRPALAWLALIACLMVREDAGLHLACVLIAYLILAALAERGLPARTRETAPYLAVCLLYPAGAILAQRLLAHPLSTFQSIYTGVPPYAHLTPALMAARLKAVTLDYPQALITLAASVVPFLVLRRWIALAGALAALPWLALNLAAHSDAAGDLSLYYPFPFLPLVLTPFILTTPLGPGAASPRRRVVATALCAFLLLASNARHGLHGYLAQAVSPQREQAVRQAIGLLSQGRSPLVGIQPCDAIKAFLPDRFTAAETRVSDPDPRDVIVCFNGGFDYDDAFKAAAIRHLTWSRGLAGDAVVAFAPSEARFLAVTRQNGLSILPDQLVPFSLLIHELRPQRGTRPDGAAWQIDSGHDQREVLFGPYARLIAGRYRLRVTLEPEADEDCAAFGAGLQLSLAVTAKARAETLAPRARLVPSPPSGPGCDVVATRDFTAPGDVDAVETPIWLASPHPAKLVDYDIAPLK